VQHTQGESQRASKAKLAGFECDEVKLGEWNGSFEVLLSVGGK